MGKFRNKENPSPSSPSTSFSRNQTLNGSHEFKIAGYSLSKGIGISKHMSSDTFMVGGHLWAIYFYPDGKSDNTSYVSLFIALVSEATNVRALFELSLLDQSGKGRHRVHSHFAQSSVPYDMEHRGCMWGFNRFIKRTALETSDFLKDDCLLINCTVGVVKSHIETPNLNNIWLPPSNIGQQLGQLLESGEGADVNFEVDGEVFAAHKFLLAVRSPVFKAQFFGPMKHRDGQCIKVEEMTGPVFKALLHFIYWDTLPDMQELAGLISNQDSTLMVQHLLAAADRYGVDRLRILCESKLCEDVAINTVLSTLALAEQHHCIQLKAVCLKFMALPENLKAVMQTDGFEYFKEGCPAVLIELLEHVARIDEHSVIAYGGRSEAILDGPDVNGRRIKQRIY